VNKTAIVIYILLSQLIGASLIFAQVISTSTCLLEILNHKNVNGQIFKTVEKTLLQIAEELNHFIVSPEKATQIYNLFRSMQMDRNEIEIFKYLVDHNLYFRKIYFRLGYPKTISITLKELDNEIWEIISNNNALKYIQKTAADFNIDVSVSGFNAAEIAHYAKMMLRSQKGDFSYMPGKLVNNFSNIFTFQKDFTLNFIIDSGDPHKIELFKEIIKKKFLFANVNFENGLKTESLLSHSISLTKKAKPSSKFLSDVIDGKISLSTPAKNISPDLKNYNTALEVLTLASRFELGLTKEMKSFLKAIINDFNPTLIVANDDLNFEFQKNGLKIFLNSINLDHTFKILKEVDPEGKLAIRPPKIREAEFSSGAVIDFYNKKPLTVSPISKKRVIDKTIVTRELSKKDISQNLKLLGMTAGDLHINLVSHVTETPEVYSAMTRSPRGIPISFISRQDNPGMNAGNFKGELAQRGEGFYTSVGEYAVFDDYGSYVVHYQVPDNAVNGIDFKLYEEELFTSTKESLLIKEVDNIDAVDSFKQLFDNRSEGELKYNQQQWENITQLAFDPKQRELLDEFVLNKVQNAKTIYEISENGLREYLRLSMDYPQGKKVMQEIINKFMLAKNDSQHLLHFGTGFDRYLSIFINSPHASVELKDVIKWHLNNPHMHFDPYIWSPLLKEEWFVDFVKRSSYKENILKVLRRSNSVPGRVNFLDVREFIKKIE